MSTVVAVSGVIPGAGATTVVTALGSALAEQRNHVALADASTEGSRLAGVLSLPGDDRLADALRRSADLASVQVEGPHGTTCFPAAPETSWESIRPGAVASLYDDLRARYELVLVDCGSAVTPATAAWLGHADELVVVTDPDVADDVVDRVAVVEAFGVELRGVIANRVVRDEAKRAGERLDGTGKPVLAVLPEDPTVDAAAGDRQSIFEHDPDSVVANCAWELATRFADRDHAEPVVPRGWIDHGTDDSETGADDEPADDQPADDGDATASSSTAPASTGSTTASSSGSTSGADAATASSGSGSGSSSASGGGAGAAADAASAGSSGVGSTTGSPAASPEAPSASVDDGTGATAGSDRASADRERATAGSARGSDAAGDASVGREADQSDLEASIPDVTDEGVGRSSSGSGSSADRDRASGGVGTADDGASDGGISDEEIEEVFKETLERVEEDREGEGPDDRDDSLLNGFTS